MDKEGTRDWLLEQEHDGATTCILLGRMQDEDKGRLKRYQNVLWFVDSDGSKLLKHTPQTLKLGLLELLSPEDVEETIEDFLLINTFSIPDVLCANAIMERDTNAYNFLLSRIHMSCEATLRARRTRQEEGFVLQANILENLHHYISSRISDSCEGLMSNEPVAIVGAGPSLDVSIDALAHLQGKIHVFATDSALASLHARGIQPTATFSIDAEKPAKSCVPAGLDPGLVFLASKSPHDWLGNGFETVFLSGRNLTEDWLAQNKMAKSQIQCLGNCGITAVNVASFLGCSPILLFGMDHATDESGAGHATDVDQGISRGKRHNPSGRHPKVPGNYQAQVKTFMLKEWEQLNKLLDEFPVKQEFWNVTDRGARLTRARLVHPSEIALPESDIVLTSLSSDKMRQDDNPLSRILNQIRELITVHANEFKLLKRQNGSTDIDALWKTLKTIYLSPDLSMLIGGLGLKNLPHLLNWTTISTDLKIEVLNETIDILKLLAKVSESKEWGTP